MPGLNQYALKALFEPEQLQAALSQCAVLLWEAPPNVREDDLLLGTFAGVRTSRPTTAEPMVFEVRKAAHPQNAFALGVTVGRTPNNDVVIDDNSVSRFHAYLQQKRGDGWQLFDAESTNGTWHGQRRLAVREPVELTDGAEIRFGDVALRFYSSRGFLELLHERIGPGQMRGLG